MERGWRPSEILSWELGAAPPQHALFLPAVSYFRLEPVSPFFSHSLSSLAFTMLSSSHPSSLALLCGLLSLGLAGTDARATPNPAPLPPSGQTIPLMRRGNPHVDNVGEWLQNNRLATHNKYGVGAQSSQQKRASGVNMCVRPGHVRPASNIHSSLVQSHQRAIGLYVRPCAVQNITLSYRMTCRYFGSIAVGTPPTSFDVILDTGSAYVACPPRYTRQCLNPLHSDLWLASSPSAASGRTGREISLFEPSCQFYIRLLRHLIDCYSSPASSTFQDLNQPFAIQYGSGSAQGFLGVDRVQFAGFEVNQTFGQ